jgi:ribosomal protein S18 acetylase RimI-like enzyme
MVEIREAGWDDFDRVVGLLDARSRAAFGTSEVEAAHVRQRWELPGYDVGWVAHDNGALVGYGGLDSTHDVAIAADDPSVGDELFARLVERARARGFDHVVVVAVPADEPLSALVRRNGFDLDREILRMWRPLDGPLPEAEWPDGVGVRSYVDADATSVHTFLDEAYAGWDTDYVPRSHDDWLAVMPGDPEFDPELWFLVERDGELVACALHWKVTHQRGWVKDIAVRENERGNGLGKALLNHACREYAARGATKVGLKVDSTNPTGAPELYERVGFITDQRYGIWIKRL